MEGEGHDWEAPCTACAVELVLITVPPPPCTFELVLITVPPPPCAFELVLIAVPPPPCMVCPASQLKLIAVAPHRHMLCRGKGLLGGLKGLISSSAAEQPDKEAALVSYVELPS
jgi:hypothetical protein